MELSRCSGGRKGANEDNTRIHVYIYIYTHLYNIYIYIYIEREREIDRERERESIYWCSYCYNNIKHEPQQNNTQRRKGGPRPRPSEVPQKSLSPSVRRGIWNGGSNNKITEELRFGHFPWTSKLLFWMFRIRSRDRRKKTGRDPFSPSPEFAGAAAHGPSQKRTSRRGGTSLENRGAPRRRSGQDRGDHITGGRSKLISLFVGRTVCLFQHVYVHVQFDIPVLFQSTFSPNPLWIHSPSTSISEKMSEGGGGAGLRGAYSGVSRGQREQKRSFRGYPKAKCVLVEYRGSFRGYPSNYHP